ncbi:hypothetical protein F3J45_03555 [Pantoea sp. Ap-967]|uniref:hypothetical protein n=1 Tax=Pantoea sp. Ap-967 TaxID=2608362 RepID=UPI00141FFF43|nr:hypothetical protein [Pantoea sp. Ap-967]NIE73540.1 hypothetical protein [Pantoea sp. Ap-967]
MSQTVVNLFSSSQAATETLYLRNNLASTGSVPFKGTLGLCPDIIQSPQPVPDAQNALSTVSSWEQAYNVQPQAAVPNYYYLRGMNGGSEADSNGFSLYYAPAQVLLLPATFRGHALSTAAGLEVTPVNAPAGHIGVGQAPFVWTPSPPPADSYFNLIAQVNAAAQPDPLPVVRDWLDLAKLIGQTPTLGIRTQALVRGNQWVRRQQLTVPASFTSSPITITLAAQGLAGTRVCLLCDTVTPLQVPVMLGPLTLGADGSQTGATFVLPAGYSANLAVQFWNPDNQPVAAGSSLSVTFGYSINPGAELDRAIAENLVNHHYQEIVGESATAAIKPKAMAIVSQMTFTFDA